MRFFFCSGLNVHIPTVGCAKERGYLGIVGITVTVSLLPLASPTFVTWVSDALMAETLFYVHAFAHLRHVLSSRSE